MQLALTKDEAAFRDEMREFSPPRSPRTSATGCVPAKGIVPTTS